MKHRTKYLIVGQGLAGTALAWRLLEAQEEAVLVDRAESATASKVSAGLITPWTGRRLSQSNSFQQDWKEAVSFYRGVEDQLNRPLFSEQSMLRIFVNRSDEAIFEQRQSEADSGGLTPWSGQLQTNQPAVRGCRMTPAGRLDINAYLQGTIDFFSRRGQWYEHDLDLPEAVRLTETGVEIPALNLSAEQIIFCTGAAANPWFAGIPNNRSRGDVINVQIDNYLPTEVVHHSIWLAPERDGSVTAGATYDWNYLRNEPTAAGRREILRAMQRFIEGPIRVNRHRAAVRPTMKDYQAVMGRHAEHEQLVIFTGLGSRGVLTAPRLARQLVESLTGQGPDVPPELSPNRLRTLKQARSLTQIAQDQIATVIGPGDTVVDATAGNGFDTVFLAERVGPTGIVYGFDIQEAAIQATNRRLEAAGLQNVRLQHRSHAEVHQVVDRAITAAMFNLGYLPRSDHSIVTRADTTIAALQQITSKLVPGGMVTVLAYRGHDGGGAEAEAVEHWLRDQVDCTVERIDSQPPKKSSPVLFVMRKTKE